MQIRLIAFDLDNTISDCSLLHYQALNIALDYHGLTISEEERPHYEAQTTKQKLAKLSAEKGLPEHLHGAIWSHKQRLTIQHIRDYVKPLPHINEMLESLGDYKLAICTNSIRSSTEAILEAAEIKKYFSVIITNEDVANPKPNAQPYIRTMNAAGEVPRTTLIFEDSEVGLRAAYGSRAWVCPVSGPEFLTKERVNSILKAINNV